MPSSFVATSNRFGESHPDDLAKINIRRRKRDTISEVTLADAH